MRGLLSCAGYVPYHRLRRDAIPAAVGGGGGRGTRAVAGWDEDATTMAVAAARLTLGATDARPDRLVLATSTPTYLDKTNATAVHAALRLPRAVRAADGGGAPRSGISAVLDALDGNGTALVALADVRTGLPGGPDERETGDGAAALLLGSDDDGPLVAEALGHASATAEFLDRYRPAGATTTLRWEERFGETQYLPLADEAFAAACKAADVEPGAIDHLVVTGLHARATAKAAKALAAGRDCLVDDLTGRVGNTGTAHVGLVLADVLDRAEAGAVIALVSLADGCDVLLLRATGSHRAIRPVADQVGAGRDDLDYLRFLSWRGHLQTEPPRRPSPARASASAAARATDWKFGFTGSRDESSGALHLPPARVSWDGGAVDQMQPAPMADVQATVRTFTVDHLSWSPSPPTVFAVLDFDATDDGPGGRYACQLTDVEADEVAIGDRVEMTFRRLGEADGVVNYFWKARPLPDTTTKGA